MASTSRAPGSDGTTLRGAPRPAASRRNSFDTLRLLGAVIVLVGHAGLITGAGTPTVAGIALHTLPVMMFFAISGYLITRSWMSDPDPARFALKRVLRLWPGLMVALLGTTLVIGPALSSLPTSAYLTAPATYAYIARNAVLLTTWMIPSTLTHTPVTHFNGSLWTLPFEVALYATVPVLARLFRAAPRSTTLAAIAGMATLTALLDQWPALTAWRLHAFNVGWALGLAPLFLVGALLALLGLETWPSARRARVAVAALGGLAAWAVLGSSTPVVTMALVLGPPTLTILLGTSPALHLPLLDRLGDLSYALYLWAFPVQQLMFQLAGGGPLLNIALSLPTTAVVAWGSWHLVERPALSLKPARQRQQRLFI